MSSVKYFAMKNSFAPVAIKEIPVLDYPVFHEEIISALQKEYCHCLNYFCYRNETTFQFICCIADDKSGTIKIFRHEKPDDKTPLQSITASCYSMHIFEREIHERHGIEFKDHPWLKPLRYPNERADKTNRMDNYPFYEIEGEALHEVGVGPVHAGVIEPGHFRFICNGEKVLHLEIQLGYQHRGIEKLFTDAGDNELFRSVLAENIAGDTAIGHGLAYAQLAESLSAYVPPASLQAERCIALELERIGVHIGDTAALCADVAYQLGQVVCEALRTLVINTIQNWCGNRFGKGLIRPGGSNYPMSEEIASSILQVLEEVDRRFASIADRIYTLPSVLARFEETGTVTRFQATTIGTVGMAARTCGIPRDIRTSHPFQYYKKINIKPSLQEKGDVLSRGMLRVLEVKESINIIRTLIDEWKSAERKTDRPLYKMQFKPDSIAISVTEGWRGEVCHIALTNNEGEINQYRIKDPSLHNWMALALAVRNQEISDFPLCNKSFNLSYCGNDL